MNVFFNKPTKIAFSLFACLILKSLEFLFFHLLYPCMKNIFFVLDVAISHWFIVILFFDERIIHHALFHLP